MRNQGKARGLLVVGTSSDAGKSFITAALCHYYSQQGLRVAPFKAQNMSRNSYLLPDGREMAGIQARQALACGQEPRVEMNPILLKPRGDRLSDLILLGQNQGPIKASDYYLNKAAYWPLVLEAYASLAKDYDLIIAEGAGSPAEINLLENDFVNLGLAQRLDIPAILVGDIERGGVFAAIYGTCKLLPTELAGQIKAYLINRFRGDQTILEPGIGLLSDKLDLACLGVVPYLEAYLEPEDSLSAQRDKKIIDRQASWTEEKIQAFYQAELEKITAGVVQSIDLNLLEQIIGRARP